MARRPLGRGLSALLGDDKVVAANPITSSEGTAAALSPGGSSLSLDVDLLDPNPEQPRTNFTDDQLNELAASIKANGIVQPIVVRRQGQRYQIVAGERRWRAAQRAELRKVPVVVAEIDDDRLLEIALIENIQRQELNPIEEAVAYRRLIDTLGLTQEELSTRVGKERSLISTTIRLLQLPDEVRALIVDGKLSLSHGRALLMTEDVSAQRRLAKEIVQKGMSVRAAETAVKAIGKSRQGTDSKQVSRPQDPNVRAAENKIMRRLSTNVRIIQGKGRSGKIEIEFYSMDDLDRIYQMIVRDAD